MSHEEILDELREPVRALRQLIPDVFEGYAGLSGAAMKAGALDAKTKELIALAIAVSKQCDRCIASHARGAECGTGKSTRDSRTSRRRGSHVTESRVPAW